MNRFEKLLKRLDLTLQSPNVFVGGAGAGGIGGEARLFGGLVAAQATMAAQKTVADFPLHSLHSYFLRPGRASVEIAYHVTATKDGKNFRARTVEAWQGGDCIFQLMASFQRPETSVSHSTPMPNVPPPLQLPNRDQLRGRSYWREMPIDVRMVTSITAEESRPANQQIWVRGNGDLPDDPALHVAMVVYASDRSLLDTAYRPHAGEGTMTGASLDHAMWFHQPPQFDEWLLYDMQSPVAGNGRGLAFGAMYNPLGQRVVTVAQEGLIRLTPRPQD